VCRTWARTRVLAPNDFRTARDLGALLQLRTQVQNVRSASKLVGGIDNPVLQFVGALQMTTGAPGNINELCCGGANRVESEPKLSRAKSAGLLLDSRPQMRCVSVSERALMRTKHAKISEYEQGR